MDARIDNPIARETTTADEAESQLLELHELVEVALTPEQELEQLREELDIVYQQLAAKERAAFELALGHVDEHSNLVGHARRELELAGWFEKDGMYGDMLGVAALDMIRLFASQGHSGMSAGIMSGVMQKLMRFETISENDHSSYIEHADDMWQDCRDGRYFSEDQGKTWYNVDDKHKPKPGPSYVLIFNAEAAVEDAAMGERVEVRIPQEVRDQIADYFRELGPDDEPDAGKFNLPQGVSLTIEKLTPAKELLVVETGLS